MDLHFFRQLERHLDAIPDQMALQGINDEGREVFTYRRIGREVSSVALFLQHTGVREGDTVAILMENHPRWGIAFLAAQSTGAVMAPFDVLHTDETLAYLLEHAGCQFVICSERFHPRLESIWEHLGRTLPVLAVGEVPEAENQWDQVLEEFDGTASMPLVERGTDEPFLILYTSGTTGNPKGVVLSRRNVYRNMGELLKMIQVSSRDHILSVLPLYHVLALMTNFIIPLYAGARVTYLDTLEAQRVLRAFREEMITIFVCVPQFYYLLHRRILQEIGNQPLVRRLVFRCLLAFSRFCNRKLGFNPGHTLFRPLHSKFGLQFRYFGVGGARFDEKVALSLRDLGFTIIQAYGMTETAALATLNPPYTRELGSVGMPLPHVRIRIQEPDSDGIGRVLIRGENIMHGYWKNPEETEKTFRDGWLDSGDLGYVSESGSLYITGRDKEMIVLPSGKNVFPEEVEHHYQSRCPYIKEMCVLGVQTPDGEVQERLHAVIVPDFDALRSNQVVNSQEMIHYLLEGISQELPAYKRVQSFAIRTEPLPRTTTRKIKRFVLQQEVEASAADESPARFEAASAPETPTEERIFEMLRRTRKAPLIHREMNLELDLRFDSLERVEFVSSLQDTFGVRISDEAAAEILTVDDLVRAVEGADSPDTEADGSSWLSWGEILANPLEGQDAVLMRKTLGQGRLSDLAFYATAKTVHTLARILFRVKARGTENLPREYPFMLCPNHLSYLDAFLVAAVLPYRLTRRLFFLGYSDYFVGRFTSWVGRFLKVVPVDSDRYLRQALRLGAEGLKKGKVLCVFPEGTRSIDGRLKPFRKGPAILSTELKVPVVPVGIAGTYEAWRRGSNRIRLHPVEITFGKPFLPDPADYQEATQRIFQSVEQLIPTRKPA